VLEVVTPVMEEVLCLDVSTVGFEVVVAGDGDAATSVRDATKDVSDVVLTT